MYSKVGIIKTLVIFKFIYVASLLRAVITMGCPRTKHT